MSEEQNILQTINNALLHHDPQKLTQLSEYFSSWTSLLQLRDIIGRLDINQSYYDVILTWFWHEEPSIAKIVRTIKRNDFSGLYHIDHEALGRGLCMSDCNLLTE